MKSEQDNSILTEKGSIVMIEIPKILSQINDFDHMSSLEKWVYFLKNGNKLDDPVIEKLTKEPMFERALEVVKMVNNDQKIKDAAFARMQYELDLNQSHFEGKREGLEEGRREERKTMKSVLQMLKKGCTFEEIQKETGMELEDILEIQDLMK